MIRRWLREPLVHFLIAGAVLFAFFAWRGEEADPASRTIDVTREVQARLALGFERAMQRPPTDAELGGLIQRWVREEVLYREALRLGLGQDDVVVRRRLAKKMDGLASAQAEVAAASEAELEQWLADYPGEFERGGVLNFEQAVFASEDAALAAMGQAEPAGQSTSLPRSNIRKSAADIAAVYGSDFAETLGELSVSSDWQGPVRSGFGWHLVHLYHREEGSTPAFAAIRDEVEDHWRSATIAARKERAFKLLREPYVVEVE